MSSSNMEYLTFIILAYLFHTVSINSSPFSLHYIEGAIKQLLP